MAKRKRQKSPSYKKSSLRIHRDNPDYLFGQTGMVGLYLEEGNTQQAEEIIRSLLTRSRLHITEFVALCQAEIKLQLAKGQPEGAQQWLEMWRQADPANPDLKYWQERAGGLKSREKIAANVDGTL